MKCDDFRTLPADSATTLRDLRDCERHLQLCEGCRGWLPSAPDTAAYRRVRLCWAAFLEWINRGRQVPLYR